MAESTASPPVVEWLLLVHELPARPSNVRVKTWRRLQSLGAVAVKNSIYVLPNSPAAREDFEWMKAEIEAMRGEATVFLAQAMDGRTTRELIAAFRRAREADYTHIRRDAERLLASAGRRGMRASPRRQRTLESLRARLAHACALDFFGAPGRLAAEAAVQQFERQREQTTTRTTRVAEKGEPRMTGKFTNRTWVTRPRPGVDRMASAWLIRRFIDPRARFQFADQPKPGTTLPFDMYGVEFGHHGNHCTFETLAQRFGVAAAPVRRLGRIVHDVDLKDDRYNSPEAPAVRHMVEGLRQMCADDHELLERGITFFEALFRSFAGEPAARAATGRAPRKRNSSRRRAR
jgi:hypothetical protein